MKKLSSLVFSAIFAGAIGTVSFPVAAEPYLFEMLKKPAYQKAWNELFTKEVKVDAWLAQYNKTKNGPAGPGEIVTIQNTKYQINSVCKTHDCANNSFIALFAPNGKKAWGLLLKEQKYERFFGNPSDEIKNALREAVKSNK